MISRKYIYFSLSILIVFILYFLWDNGLSLDESHPYKQGMHAMAVQEGGEVNKSTYDAIICKYEEIEHAE